MQRILPRHSGIHLLLFLFFGLARSPMTAQNANTGEIKGTVEDSSGAVVPDAQVTIQNVQTGAVKTVKTNNAGLYDVPFLSPGNYTVTFSKEGFQNFLREGIVLQIQTLDVSVTLQVGATTQQIVVNAAPPPIDTDTSSQHLDLSAHSIETAPVVGADWRSEMTQLIPGVNTGGGAGQATGQSIGVNGTQSYNVNFLTDGSSATAPRDYNGSNFYMPVDAIAEVSIDSSNAPAQYGNGLTSINVITKSGTNQFHGSAFEFVQNTAFNARGFYNETGPKSVEHWNEYGGSIGGPIVKDKLFFFFDYQRNPNSSPTSGLYSYPTAAMQAGNFYGISGATGTAFSSSGALLGTYDPVALKLQSYFPKAGARGWVTGCPGPVTPSPTNPQTCPTINNFVWNSSSPNLNTWYTSREDYNSSDRHKLSFSFNYFPAQVSYVPPDPLYPSDATAFSQANNYNLTGQLTYTFTISPTMVNEFRIGGSREYDKYVPPSLGKNDPTLLGLEPAYGSNAPANVFPNITIDSGAGVGSMGLAGGNGSNGNIDATLADGTYNASDVLTLVHGRHTIKLGGEYDKTYQNYTSWGDITSGNFEFNGSVTGVPYADFLAGDVYGWYVYESDPTSANMWQSALFASDDFKVTPHLTLNLGLRWQVQSGWSVKHNLFGEYDPNLPDPADGGQYPGGILYGGQSDKQYGGSISNLSTIQNTDYKEFAPRIGFAWSPSPNWSLRGSYGVFDAPRDAENYTDGALGLGFDPHNVGYGGYVNGTDTFKLMSGPPAGTVVFPTVQTLSSTLGNYSSVTYYPRNMPTNHVQNVLFSVQRALPGQVVLDSSYVYTRGTNLNFATDINQAPVSMLGCSGYNCGNPNPIFTAIQAQNYSGWSNYNALQLRLEKRFSHGLNFLVNYAWSKSLDTGTGNGHGSGVDLYQNAYSPGANYGPSDFNAAQTVTGQLVYQVPFGNGRQFALHGVLDQVLGGWRVSSVFQLHSGVPFTPVIQSSVADGIDPGLTPSLQAGSTLLPVLAGNPAAGKQSITQWFNPAAFANPGYGSFGNVGRNALIGPGFANMDLSLGKTFLLHWEGIKLDVRADAYNVLNHINFANPDANVGYTSAGVLADPTAGELTGPAGGNGNRRIMQLGARLTF